MESPITVKKDSFCPVGEDIFDGIVGKNAIKAAGLWPVKRTAQKCLAPLIAGLDSGAYIIGGTRRSPHKINYDVTGISLT